MTTDDIAPASAAILADDWGDRRSWFEFAVGSAQCRTFVAETGAGKIVGTGVATLNGPVGWIGTIWVAPAWRGQGLGRRLTEVPIEAAEGAGCRTLVLVATRVGRPLYERLGFEVQTTYRIMETTGLAPDARGADTIDPGRRVRVWRPGDLDAMAAMDVEATGEDRRHLLRAFASSDGTRVVVGADDRPRGFVVRAPWGGGATIAPDPGDALAILDARRRVSGPDRTIRAGLVDENVDGLARLMAAGWTEAWHAPRLVRGDQMTWRPEAIWGQFNHAVG